MDYSGKAKYRLVASDELMELDKKINHLAENGYELDKITLSGTADNDWEGVAVMKLVNGQAVASHPDDEDDEEVYYRLIKISEQQGRAETSEQPDNEELHTANRFVKRTERGWAGHFIDADKCRFRRNTLLEYNDIAIVVSTVGLFYYNNEVQTVGRESYFETMAFHTNKDDKRHKDADVTKQVHFDSEWAINEIDADDKANEMHEAVVSEIMEKLLKGCRFEVAGC